MITENEIQATKLSATKKDFYQIWNELLETAGKISERWDPTSTNESDPGIVLLKVLAGLGDKLNYNIDKNILEAFMPSAAQEESMRKLCEMMGYNMKYYQAASTTATISYIGSTELSETQEILIDAFTSISNTDNTISFVTTAPVKINKNSKTRTVECLEGAYVQCSNANDDYLISLEQLDDNNRYILPETQIAENGIFVYNVDDMDRVTGTAKIKWTKVDNLNTQTIKTKCYKFGFDSRLGLPYLQFPDDINNIIEDGLLIGYIRTNGVNGNISARTLNVMSKPASWSTADTTAASADTYTPTVEDFTVTNTSAAVNGANVETLNKAYNNYKKTIGTFDTLITCRDYMNKIYQLTISDTNQTPLVSNVIVSDVRDDINRALTVCSFDEYGICYNDFKCTTTTITDGVSTTKNQIENFDIIVYPFSYVINYSTKDDFKKSFSLDNINMPLIRAKIKENKTLAHTIRTINPGEIACIKNYLKLNARITTTYKVNKAEQNSILKNIKLALFKTFNMRELDFGEEIPYDSLVSCIEEADVRIKNVNLDEPELETKVCLASNPDGYSITEEAGKALFNKLALRNVLAGKVSMFKYVTDFKSTYTEKNITGIDPVLPTDPTTTVISKIEPSCTIENCTNLKLADNEIIQFRTPNYKTVTTYPAYVNYYLKLNTSSEQAAVPATLISIKNFIDSAKTDFIDFINETAGAQAELEPASASSFNTLKTAGYIMLTKNDSETYVETATFVEENTWYLALGNDTLIYWNNFITSQTINGIKLKGIFKIVSRDVSNVVGYLVDNNHRKFKNMTVYVEVLNPLTEYFVQETHASSSAEYTIDGLGANAISSTVQANVDYKLGEDEFLLVNYTTSNSSSDTADDASTKTIVNKVWPSGTVIKANFNVIDSATNTKSKSKILASDFTDLPAGSDPVTAMYTLSTDQQIEIREPASIKLAPKTTSSNLRINLYWNRNDEEDHTSGDTITFTFDEITSTTKSYVLKDGEYVYYTDENKLDIAYYGSGTKITVPKNFPAITKSKSSNQLDTATISELGLAAAIDWQCYTLVNSLYVQFDEYKYFTLTAGDTLNSIVGVDENTITSDFKPVGKNEDNISATYTLAGADSSIQELKAPLNNTQWEVRSLLALNVGPAKAQTLRYAENGEGDTKCTVVDELKVYKNSSTILTTISPNSTNSNISIKTNYALQTTATTVSTYVVKYDEDGTVTERIDDFKIKIFKEEPPTFSGDQTQLTLNDYGVGNAWTKLTFSKTETDGSLPALAISLPSTSHFGLIMMHYTDSRDGETGHTNAKIIASGIKIKLFNTANVASTEYTLKSGINVLEVIPDTGTTGTLTVFADITTGDDASYSSIVLSDMDIVKTSDEINPTLNYQVTQTGVTRYAQLLQDITNTGVTDFYYNALLDSSGALDINTEAGEQLSDSAKFYDYNNINNKFVISEIDADYLSTGLRITNSSKL